jgi:hemoglobin
MKPDIVNKEDIKLLIDCFYEKVRADDTIAYFFTEVVQVNWEKHLPVMYSFWENVLFHQGGYAGNPMLQHQHLHQKSPMNAAHFKRWLLLFSETVDELYNGDNAETIKQRATSIATVMQIKIHGLGPGQLM